MPDTPQQRAYKMWVMFPVLHMDFASKKTLEVSVLKTIKSDIDLKHLKLATVSMFLFPF